MDDKVRIGLAVAAGYLLGRTKKGKAALSLALWLAGSELGIKPRQLAREGILKLAGSPQVADLGAQLRGPVVEAGRRAAVATLESSLTRVADNLHERTALIGDQTRESARKKSRRITSDDDDSDKSSQQQNGRSKSGRKTSSNSGSSRSSGSSTSRKGRASQDRGSSGSRSTTRRETSQSRRASTRSSR